MRIVMIVINRLVWPCAKYSIEKWYTKSDLFNTSGMPASELGSQKVYRTMDKLDEFSNDIETALCKVISAQEGITFKRIYLDFPNQEATPEIMIQNCLITVTTNVAKTISIR